jgi:hypothetical protein
MSSIALPDDHYAGAADSEEDKSQLQRRGEAALRHFWKWRQQVSNPHILGVDDQNHSLPRYEAFDGPLCVLVQPAWGQLRPEVAEKYVWTRLTADMLAARATVQLLRKELERAMAHQRDLVEAKLWCKKAEVEMRPS